MMISQPALICLHATWQRLMGKSARDVEPVAAQALHLPVQEPVLASEMRDVADAAAERPLAAPAANRDVSRAPVARKEEQAIPNEVDAASPWPRTSAALAPRRCEAWRSAETVASMPPGSHLRRQPGSTHCSI